MTADEQTGRYRQRRRTRAAIVAAAMELMKDGRAPSMSQIAEAADVSRRTIYLYFPTLEQLLLDATLGALTQSPVDEAIEAADPGGQDAGARVEAMVTAIDSLTGETLPLGRSLIRLTVDAPGDNGVPRRGYRRVAWIEQAVGPLRDRLGPERFERLVSALAMVIGWEARIVLQDIRGLPPGRQGDVCLWAARALIAAAVAEAGSDPGH
jgi:AcrR family transcriptional regulator